ncbi:MAG: DUF3014 domain-containing protein [Candidatus Aminicenantes bacterium]|nr:DUF3014 domain-containing protein [Candidatus Aminicenantes bacterium]
MIPSSRGISMQSYRIIIVISILLTVTIIALYIHFFVINKSNDHQKPLLTAQAEGKPPPAKKPSTEKKPLPPTDFPPMNNSDNFIQESLKSASPLPEFRNWLKEKDIIRRFVAIVDNMVNGESPAVNLKFLKPEKTFQIIKNKNDLILDPNNYIRYDRMITIITSLNTQTLINLFQQIEPLLDEAYQKLGYPGGNFRPAFFRALRVVLDIPVINSPILLEKKVITYSFEKQELENLNPAQKQILRLGPENILKIQKKCREFIGLLNSGSDQ